MASFFGSSVLLRGQFTGTHPDLPQKGIVQKGPWDVGTKCTVSAMLTRLAQEHAGPYPTLTSPDSCIPLLSHQEKCSDMGTSMLRVQEASQHVVFLLPVTCGPVIP